MRIVLFATTLLLISASATASPQYFSDCATRTGESASVIITAAKAPLLKGEPLQPGDELAVFTPAGLCAGAAIWTGGSLAIAVWGNNSATPDVDGFVAGDEIRFKAARDGEVFGDDGELVSVVLNDAFDSGPYARDAIFVVDMLEFAAPDEFEPEKPYAFELKPAFPNPFTQRATLAFSVPETADVRLEIFDMLGRRVAMVLDETLMAGAYERSFEPPYQLAAGAYIARLRAGEHTSHVRMTLLR